MCYSASFTNKMNLNINTNTKRQFSTAGETIETVPALGDSITSAVIKEWTKQPGEAVAMDDIVAVVETDKVTVDIRAQRAGVFVEGMGEEGDEIPIGAPLYKLGAAVAGGATEATPAATSTEAATPASTEAAAPTSTGVIDTVTFPLVGDSVTSGVIAEWHFGIGDAVAMDDIVVTVGTDKTTADVRAKQSGKLVKIYVDVDAEVVVDEKLFDIEVGASGASTASTPAPTTTTAAPVTTAPTTSTPTPAKKAPTTPAPEVKVAGVVDRSEKRVKMSRMRQRISQRLKESQNTAAMLTTFQEVDMTNLIAIRNKYKEAFEKKHSIKLGFMSAFVLASTSALQEVNAVNAVIDDATNEIIYRDYVDISVAVASPSGLVVPVLRNCENMDFADVEKSIGMYGQRAKEGKLAVEDMIGGTFTISNGGVFGSLYGTPIINPPQSAILGMHATKMRAVVIDHRLIDGREAVTFLKAIQNKIEDPARLLLKI